MKKKVYVFIIIIVLIFVCANTTFESKKAVSDDNLWKIIFVKYPLVDEWEGFLFYKGNLTGDIGEIERCIVKYNDSNSNEYYKDEPEKYYGRQFRDPLSLSPVWAMGPQRLNTYSTVVSWSEPKEVIVDILWHENETKQNSQIVLKDTK